MKESSTSQRLQQILSERNWKQIDILSAVVPYTQKYGVKMNKSDISQYVSGKVIPSQEKLTVLSKALGVTEPWLMGYDVSRALAAETSDDDFFYPDMFPIETRTVPLLGTIYCGEPSYAAESFDSYVMVGSNVPCDFALRAKGDSMIGARIHDGDIVFIRRQDTVDNGDIAAVSLDDDATLKRVRFLKGGLTMLMAENPRYEPIVIGGEDETRTVHILGKAVAFQGDVL